MNTYGTRRKEIPFERLLFALHSCASPDDVYGVVDEHISSFVHARGYGWYWFNAGTREPCVIKARGVSERFLERYESEGRRRDPLFRRVAESLRAACSDIDLNRRERRRFIFQERISSGQVGHAIEAPLVINGELAGTLNVSREPHQRPFGQLELERTAMVARHASLAIARAQRLSDLYQRSMMLQAACDLLSAPLIISEDTSRLIFANRAANLLVERRGDAVASGLHVAARTLADKGGAIATAFVPLDPSDNTGLIVRSARLGNESSMVSFISEGRREQSIPAPALSVREREMVELVARGLSNVEIAAATAISCNTVKQHLKHVFEKTRVRSRAELAARFAAGEPEVTASLDGAP